MLGIVALGTAYIFLNQKYTKEQVYDQMNLGHGKNTANNDRTALLFDPESQWQRNLDIGNWPWGRPITPTPTTTTWFRQPTPELSGITDWTHEGNFWLKSPEFREGYIKNYRNAWSTETAHAVRTQLVGGFQRETITKGRVLNSTNRSDGRRDPTGLNLMDYQ